MAHDMPDKSRDKEWKAKLSPQEYQVARCSATEPPFTGKYWNHKGDGKYMCVCCGAALFDAKAKYNSGTGWPSFWEAVDTGRIKEVPDRAYGMDRIEVRCAACDAHLGHLFDDGPEPSGQRYCINSASLDFKAS